MKKKGEKLNLFAFIKNYTNLLGSKKKRFFFFYSLVVIASFGSYIITYLLGRLIDFFAIYQKGTSISEFYIITFFIALIGIIQHVLRTTGKLHIKNITGFIRKNTRELAIAKLIDLDIKWHNNQNAGSKIQKINSGSESIHQVLSNFLTNQFTNVATGIIFSIIIFIALEIKYALFALIFVTIFLTIENRYNKKIALQKLELEKIKENVSGNIHESVSNITSIKSLGLKKNILKKTKNDENIFLKKWNEMQTNSLNKLKYTKSYAAIGYALFILMIGFDFINGKISLGSILIFASYFTRLTDSMYNISEMWNNYMEYNVKITRLMSIIGKKSFDRESNKYLEIPPNWKKIEFKNVYFKYKNKLVLKNFNLTIKRNDKIGIVGRTGCGKSTLIKLILGIYKVNQGSILIDNININKIKYSSITQTITPVLQETEIFNASLKENITISSTKEDLDLLKKSIQLAELQEVISQLNKGLNSTLGEKGYKFSGGERQRIGIARAIYKDTPVLFFDEATSSLDSNTEKKVIDNLKFNLKNKTFIAIAHRLSTLKNVDKIIVLKEGSIIEQDTFSNLLKKKGEFYHLHKLQNKKN